MAASSWFVFAGGGTGGHLFPALSVVEVLRQRGVPVDVSFFCTDRPIDRDILGKVGVEAVPQGVLPFAVRPRAWPRFLLRWHQAVRFCMRQFRARRPTVVVGAGGYASGPPVRAAAKLGIPTFLLNPDAVPGRANRHMAVAHTVRGVFAQWEVTRRYFPPSVPVIVTGCPVRAGFREAAAAKQAEVRTLFGLDPNRLTVLVTGASQGARTVNEVMLKVADTVAQAGAQILHLSGSADAACVEEGYRQIAAERRLAFKVLAFTDRMAEAMVAADLIVSRAGASSLSEIQAVGRPSILFPYPYHRDQHQRHNAAVLEQAGAAVLLDDRRDADANAAQLRPVLQQLLGDETRRRAMAEAARKLDCPAAADRIADSLIQAACDHPAGAA